MISVKNEAVVNALMALRRLDEVKLASPTSLKLVKLNRVLAQHWEDVNNVRQVLVKEHAMLDEQGEPIPGDEPGSIKIAEAKKKDFEGAITALFEQTLDVDEKLVLSVSTDFAGINIEPSVLQGLGDLVTE